MSARLQEAERLLCEREALVKAVSLERDQALKALRAQSSPLALDYKEKAQVSRAVHPCGPLRSLELHPASPLESGPCFGKEMAPGLE